MLNPAEDTMGRTNYIFVDFENVQETELDRIANKPVKVALILGQRHKSLPLKLVKSIHQFPEQVRLVETTLNGKNALDFVLAYEAGVESQRDPNGYFHVISRDTGFDAMIAHLKGKHVLAARHAAFADIPILMNAGERVQRFVSHFRANQAHPKRRDRLESQIQAIFGKALSPEEIADTIQGLIREKFIVCSENAEIAYKI
ncbi:MAG TPA: PIN domain-containing protein [Candidatus Acidoferrum sp.]|nr:PIN domain-containing protein [Candidatus Acidoferrum sp.]